MPTWYRLILIAILSAFFQSSCSSFLAVEEDIPNEQEVNYESSILFLDESPADLPFQTPTPIILSTPTPQRSATLIPPPTSTFRLCSPLEWHSLESLPAVIGDPYNPPPPGREERHHGVDFAYYTWGDRQSMLGEPVQSILPGVVASALHDRFPYGNTVIIETPATALTPMIEELIGLQDGESLYVLYAHMHEHPLVVLGEPVDACQHLGEVGKTGNTDIPHLHLETRIGPAGSVFESMLFYSTRATQEEMDTYVLWRTSGVFRHFDPMILLNAEVFP